MWHPHKEPFYYFYMFQGITYIIITLTTPTTQDSSWKNMYSFQGGYNFFPKLLSKRKLSVTIWKIPPKKFPLWKFCSTIPLFHTSDTHDNVIHFLVCKNTLSKLQRISRLCFFLVRFSHSACYTRLWLTKDKNAFCGNELYFNPHTPYLILQ